MDEESTRWELEGEALVLQSMARCRIGCRKRGSSVGTWSTPSLLHAIFTIHLKKMIRSSLSIKVEEEKKRVQSWQLHRCSKAAVARATIAPWISNRSSFKF